MRKSKLSAAEIEAAELKESNRRSSRRDGFSMMDERDRGWAKLSNGWVFLWNVPDDKRIGGLTYAGIPEGHFGLEVQGKVHLFENEEFQKALRWT